MTGAGLLAVLGRVRTLRFSAVSQCATGWNGRGEGLVDIQRPSPDVVIFQEAGHWQPERRQPVAFSNVYRWSLQAAEPGIRLEHLRRGPLQPVYLLDLLAQSSQDWHCAGPHRCGDDSYELRVQVPGEGHGIRMSWQIHGPKKNEEIEYFYGF